jgi:hypothetical protein
MDVTSLPLLWQVGWIGGKKIDVHPWRSRINPHKRHWLWSTLDVESNIPYLPNLG